MSQSDSHGTFLLFSLQTTAPLLGISPFEYLLLPPRSALKAVPLKSYRQVLYNPSEEKREKKKRSYSLHLFPSPLSPLPFRDSSAAFHSHLRAGRLLLYSLKIPVHTGASSLKNIASKQPPQSSR